jgi:hypothetical protein
MQAKDMLRHLGTRKFFLLISLCEISVADLWENPIQNSSGLCVCPVGHVLNKVINSCISVDLCLSHQNGVCNVLRGTLGGVGHLLGGVGAAVGGVGHVVAGVGASVGAAVDAAVKVKIGA